MSPEAGKPRTGRRTVCDHCRRRSKFPPRAKPSASHETLDISQRAHIKKTGNLSVDLSRFSTSHM